jgi:hypothetical protein
MTRQVRWPTERSGMLALLVLLAFVASACEVDERYYTCLDEDLARSEDQAATYVYRVNHQQWPEDQEWAHHLRSFPNNGVSDGTGDEMAIGEVWGPFGVGCHRYDSSDNADGNCLRWAYNASTDWTCDARESDPDAVCFNTASNYCNPDQGGYEGCIAKLHHLPGRPNPRDVRNVILFFPGVFGANRGSGITGQRAYHATQDAFWRAEDNKVICPFDNDSLMGRIVTGREEFDGNTVGCPYDEHACGDAACGSCFGPDNTLLVGVWDSAIDTTETQDYPILKGFEELIALRTNLYENVERIWIVGGSRGGSTAIYLGSLITRRFKGTFSPRLPATGLGGPTYNRIYNHGIDDAGQDRDRDELKFVFAGYTPHSMPNDPDQVAYWQRLVSHPWGYHDPAGAFNRACHDCADGPDAPASHGNGHDFVSMFAQNGANIWSNGSSDQPTLLVVSTEDWSTFDPMFHVRCDSADCEDDAELGVHRNWPYCVWYYNWDDSDHSHGYPADERCDIWNQDLSAYTWPFEGPSGQDAGSFFTMLFPLTRDQSEPGGYRRLRHEEMTREWTDDFHNRVVNYMFDKLFDGVVFDGGDARLPREATCAWVTGREVDCYDGRDDDYDGLVDGHDPDCEWMNEGFSEQTCSDGIDQDADGDTDCEDLGCCDQSICMEPYSRCMDVAYCVYDCYRLCGGEHNSCYDSCAAACYH